MLFPEYTRSRIPTDIAVRSGLVSRSQTYTITTNASGNALFTLYPNYVTNNNWGFQFNAATLDVDAGTQSTAGTAISGPMYNLTSVVTYRLTGCSLELQPITSSLNNQGRVICTMNNYTSLISATSAPNGITTARDCEYVVYSSVAGSVGHRLVYHNTSVAEDSFVNYVGAADTDYL